MTFKNNENTTYKVRSFIDYSRKLLFLAPLNLFIYQQNARSSRNYLRRISFSDDENIISILECVLLLNPE